MSDSSYDPNEDNITAMTGSVNVYYNTRKANSKDKFGHCFILLNKTDTTMCLRWDIIRMFLR